MNKIICYFFLYNRIVFFSIQIHGLQSDNYSNLFESCFFRGACLSIKLGFCKPNEDEFDFLVSYFNKKFFKLLVNLLKENIPSSIFNKNLRLRLSFKQRQYLFSDEARKHFIKKFSYFKYKLFKIKFRIFNKHKNPITLVKNENMQIFRFFSQNYLILKFVLFG